MMTLKASKIALIYIFGVMLQIATKDVMKIAELFDKAVSIGLLGLGIVVVYKLYRESQRRNTQRDNDYEQLLERTVKALENSTQAINRITEKIENNN